MLATVIFLLLPAPVQTAKLSGGAGEAPGLQEQVLGFAPLNPE